MNDQTYFMFWFDDRLNQWTYQGIQYATAPGAAISLAVQASSTAGRWAAVEERHFFIREAIESRTVTLHDPVTA